MQKSPLYSTPVKLTEQEVTEEAGRKVEEGRDRGKQRLRKAETENGRDRVRQRHPTPSPPPHTLYA
ncbi:MAG: hypothetical protein AN484_27605, partial [Aphanizomenon flos-aquae WA102]